MSAGLTADRKTIVLSAVILEGCLAAAAYFWALYRGYAFGVPAWNHLMSGALAAVPLLLLNGALLTKRVRANPKFHRLNEFRNEIVLPLAEALDAPSALFISVLAGVGEELFFRGVLQREIGLLLSSAVFGALHFGPALKRFL